MMIVLKIVCILLGITSLGFGYFIYFKKKFNLINGFKEDYASGKKSEQYARRVGLIEFLIGATLLAAGIFLCIFVK